MANNSKPRRAPGSQQPFVNLNPQYQLANTAPTIYDNYEPSTIWIQQVDTSGNPVNEIWIMSSTQNGMANWIQIAAQGGPGVFSSLTVNPGPINFTGVFTQLGTVNMNTSGAANTNIGTGTNSGTVAIGSGNSAAVDILAPSVVINSTAGGAIDIGQSLVGGVVLIGGALQTASITLGDSTAGQPINIGNAVNVGAQSVNIASGASGANSTVNILAGNATAGTQIANILTGTRAGQVNIGTNALAANAVTIGSSNVNAGTTIRGGTTGGISINAGGAVGVISSTATAASPVATITQDNLEIITATFTGFTTANAGGAQAYTINSNLILTTSGIMVNVTNLDASTNGAFLTITGIIQAAGSIVVNTANNGAGPLGAGDDVIVTVWILG